MHFEAPDPLVEIQRVLHEVVGLPANSPDGFELKRLAGCYVLTAEGRELRLPDIFFANSEDLWLTQESLPSLPLEELDPVALGLSCPLVNRPLPILFGVGNGKAIDCDLQVDLFGSIYFLLSRYEEGVLSKKDEHGRFPAKASLAFRGGFLFRPLVDEYVEVFWSLLRRTWPGITRKQHEPRTLVSCDLDWPFDPAVSSFYLCLRKAMRRIFKEGSVKAFFAVLSNYWRHLQGDMGCDKFYSTLLWMLEVNEAAGNQVLFNFIPCQTHKKRDNIYPIHNPEVRNLLRKIHERGHEVGFHPGYNTFDNEEEFALSATAFWQAVDDEGISQESFGGRQHFLRWRTPVTARLWESNGFQYDSSLGFADHVGFRCGTCREFPVFELDGCRPSLRLRERPLVLMESSIMDGRYMGLGSSAQALNKMLEMRDICRRFRGDFTLLWHNTELISSRCRVMYQQLL